MQTTRVGTLNLGLGVACLVSPASAGAAEIEVTKLPPAANQTIDFGRDIQPILQANCLQCHGPERPKGGFRLTDRASALKGGAGGVAMLPAESVRSPLIHYVARLVPDMEMPPEGKGTPLTPEQVGLLRAWIDQGVVWDAAGASNTVLKVEATPFVSWTGVSGKVAKFRELERQPDGWNGGLESFRLEDRSPDGRSVTAEGFVRRDEYRVSLSLRRPELGFAELGAEQSRRYFSDAGGYYPAFLPSQYRSRQDLFVDSGRAWANLGLTLPEWPRVVLGYEYAYKEGNRALLAWGPVNAAGGAYQDARGIYPSVRHEDERAHLVRLGISYELGGFELEDRLRLQFYDLSTRRMDALDVPAGGTAPDSVLRIDDRHRQTQVDNSFTVQKELASWWLAGLGYRYSWLDGDTTASLATLDGTGQAAAGSAWSAGKLLLNEVWQMANANSQFLPFSQLSLTLGVQGQWKRQETFGDVNLDEVIDPTDPTGGVFHVPATERSVLDLAGAEENVLARYTGLPHTTLFAESRLKQESYDRTADQDNGPHAFQLGADAEARWHDTRVGFSSSPWRLVSVGGHYRRRDRETDYTYPLAQRDSAYPGFIQQRGTVTDEVEARIGFSPTPWWRSSLSYQVAGTDFHTIAGSTSPVDFGSDATPGGRQFAGRYLGHTVSGSVSLTPLRRVTLSSTVSYQNSRTTTAAHGDAAVAPYRGDLWSVVSSVHYLLDEATELYASHVYSEARYGQHDWDSGLPLGVDYHRHAIQGGLTRRISKNVTARLQYGYFTYVEPSSGHLNDYTAHQVLGLVNVRLP